MKARPRPIRRAIAAAFVTPALIAVSQPALGGTVANAPEPADVQTADSLHAGQLDVPLNKSQMLTLDRAFSRVMVGNDEVADIMPVSSRSIYVLGRKLGTTSLTIFDRSNRVMSVIDVAVGPDVVSLRRQLSELMPGENIGASISNEAVVLRGIASSAPAVDRAVELAKTYAGDRVVNLLSVGTSQQVMLEVRFAEVSRQAAKEIGINHTAVSGRGKFVGGVGDSGLTGVPITTNNSANGGATVSDSYDRTDSITITPPGSTTSTRTFGGGTQSADGSSSGSSTVGLGNGALDLLLPTTGFGALGFITKLGGLRISTALDALERKGLVKTLAQPTLIALSGETASFLAGGEFPIPVLQDNQTSSNGRSSNITVEFKPFGVSLAFTPTVLADGVINLAVEPEVSSLDPSASVQINGLIIPGLKTRRANTVLELRDGEAFAVAGLLQNDFASTIRQVPLLGSLPIIGSLFRSSGFERGETELVIVVIPHLVKPTKPENISMPTDRVKDPSEADLFLNGRTDKAVPVIQATEPRDSTAMPSVAPATGNAKGANGYEY